MGGHRGCRPRGRARAAGPRWEMLPPALGLGPGMLPSPTTPHAGWLLAPAPTPARPGAGSDADGSPRACRAAPSRAGPCRAKPSRAGPSRAVPCRAARSYSLVTFWADAGGSSAQRARSPARTSTLRALGMVREGAGCACGAARPAFKLLSRWGRRAGGLGLPGGSQGPGWARLPLRACTTRVSGICRCWLPTRKGEPRGDRAATPKTRPAGTAAKRGRLRPPCAARQTPAPPGRRGAGLPRPRTGLSHRRPRGCGRHRRQRVRQMWMHWGWGTIHPGHGHQPERSPWPGPLMPRGWDELVARLGAVAQRRLPLAPLLLQPLVLLQLPPRLEGPPGCPRLQAGTRPGAPPRPPGSPASSFCPAVASSCGPGCPHRLQQPRGCGPDGPAVPVGRVAGGERAAGTLWLHAQCSGAWRCQGLYDPRPLGPVAVRDAPPAARAPPSSGPRCFAAPDSAEPGFVWLRPASQAAYTYITRCGCPAPISVCRSASSHLLRRRCWRWLQFLWGCRWNGSSPALRRGGPRTLCCPQLPVLAQHVGSFGCHRHAGPCTQRRCCPAAGHGLDPTAGSNPRASWAPSRARSQAEPLLRRKEGETHRAPRRWQGHRGSPSSGWSILQPRMGQGCVGRGTRSLPRVTSWCPLCRGPSLGNLTPQSTMRHRAEPQ